MENNLLKEAYTRLYPEKEIPFLCGARYSNRLNDYNSRISLKNNFLEVHMSKKWQPIDEEIKLGLVQSLMLRLLKEKNIKTTQNIELYHNFIKKLDLAITKTESEPVLDASFHRVNEKYFNGFLEKPNLSWGNETRVKLASYNLHTDTIAVSSLFQEAEQEVLDFLMYHELLHKKLKFEAHGLRSSFHSPEFRNLEHSFEDYTQIERKIRGVLRKRPQKGRGLLNFFKEFI